MTMTAIMMTNLTQRFVRRAQSIWAGLSSRERRRLSLHGIETISTPAQVANVSRLLQTMRPFPDAVPPRGRSSVKATEDPCSSGDCDSTFKPLIETSCAVARSSRGSPPFDGRSTTLSSVMTRAPVRRSSPLMAL